MPSKYPNSVGVNIALPTVKESVNEPDLAENVPFVLRSLVPNPIPPTEDVIETPVNPLVTERLPTASDVAVNDPSIVVFLASRVPVVDKLLLPKLIAVPADLIESVPNVIFPITELIGAVNTPPTVAVPLVDNVVPDIAEPVISSAVKFPLVVKLLFPNPIAPSLLIIEDPDMAILWTVKLPPTDNVVVIVPVPVVVIDFADISSTSTSVAEISPVVINSAAPKFILLAADVILSVAKVKLPNCEPVAAVTVPEKDPFPKDDIDAADNKPSIVVAPASRVPDVDNLLSLKVIFLSTWEVVILPSDTVIFPNDEPEAASTIPDKSIAPVTVTFFAVISPVVSKLLSEKSIVLVVSDVEIDVSPIVILPNLDPEAPVSIPVEVNVVALTCPFAP